MILLSEMFCPFEDINEKQSSSSVISKRRQTSDNWCNQNGKLVLEISEMTTLF